MKKILQGPVLLISPHTDDTEYGCGGTAARMSEAGIGVTNVAFSIAEESVPEGFARDVLATEVVMASRLLGLSEPVVHRFRVRHFPGVRQEILEELVGLRRRHSPSFVIIPSGSDTHQDHHVIHEECLRAFKGSSVLAYELPWNCAGFRPTCLVRLEEAHIVRKIAALRKYASQAHRPYMDPEIVLGMAALRGAQAGCRYAEAFEVVRWLI